MIVSLIHQLALAGTLPVPALVAVKFASDEIFARVQKLVLEALCPIITVS
jgi:hypothetical protein